MPATTPEAILQTFWTSTTSVNSLIPADDFFTGEPEDETAEPPYAVLEPLTLENHLDATGGAHVDTSELIFEIHVGEDWAKGRDLAKALFDALHLKRLTGDTVNITEIRHRTTGKVKLSGKWIWRPVFECKVQNTGS